MNHRRLWWQPLKWWEACHTKRHLVWKTTQDKIGHISTIRKLTPLSQTYTTVEKYTCTFSKETFLPILTTSTAFSLECPQCVWYRPYIFLDWKHYCTLAFQSINQSKSGPVFQVLTPIILQTLKQKGLYTPNLKAYQKKVCFSSPTFFLIFLYLNSGNKRMDLWCLKMIFL